MLNVFPTLGYYRIPAQQGQPEIKTFKAFIYLANEELVLASGPTLAVAKASLTNKLNGMKVADFLEGHILTGSDVPLACAIQPELAE